MIPLSEVMKLIKAIEKMGGIHLIHFNPLDESPIENKNTLPIVQFEKRYNKILKDPRKINTRAPLKLLTIISKSSKESIRRFTHPNYTPVHDINENVEKEVTAAGEKLNQETECELKDNNHEFI